jgi:predicted aspartyl protease
MKFLAAILALLAATLPSQAQDCLALSQSHQIFQLREAARAPGASKFCIGAYELATQQLKSGHKHLKAYLRSNPPPDAAYRTHEMLADAAIRTGRYKDSLTEIQTLLKLKPDSQDARQMASLVTALSKYPNQRTAHLEPTGLQSNDGAIPITINGKPASYSLDTGAGLCVMSENEARRFGIKIDETTSTIGDSGGLRVGARIAIARNLFIGKIHLQNVAFFVFSDGEPPFNDIPEEQRGLIGLPVILAMRSFSYDKAQHYEFAATKAIHPAPDGNMLLDGGAVVIRTTSSGKPLDFTLDTGSIDTDLYPAFSRTLPELLTQDKKSMQPSTGLGGTIVRGTTRIDSITFDIGGKTVTLAPGFVLDDTPASAHYWAAGNLGNDLLHQADKVTLDFAAMTLILE